MTHEAFLNSPTWHYFKKDIIKLINDIIGKVNDVNTNDTCILTKEQRIDLLHANIIWLRRRLAGPNFMVWRYVYPSRYMVINKLVKKAIGDLMNDKHVNVDDIVYVKNIIKYSNKDMFFIFSK